MGRTVGRTVGRTAVRGVQRQVEGVEPQRWLSVHWRSDYRRQPFRDRVIGSKREQMHAGREGES